MPLVDTKKVLGGMHEIIEQLDSSPEKKLKTLKEYIKKTPKESVVPLLHSKKENETPIEMALKAKLWGIIKYLIQIGSPLPIDSNGNTFLHHAITNNKFDLIPLLLEKQPDLVQVSNNKGDTPIAMAQKLNKWDAVKMLIQMRPSFPVDSDGNTLLHHAIACNQFDMIPFLLNIAPNLAQVCNKNGHIPLTYALYLGKVKSIKDFLSKYPKLSPDYKDGMQTPLHQAVFEADLNVVSYLIMSLPRLINIRNAQGQSPLHVAILANQGEMAPQILEIRTNIASMLAKHPQINKSLKDKQGKKPYDLVAEQLSLNCKHNETLKKTLAPDPFKPVERKSSDLKRLQKLSTSCKNLSIETNIISSDFDTKTINTGKNTYEEDSLDELQLLSESLSSLLTMSPKSEDSQAQSPPDTTRDCETPREFKERPLSRVNSQPSATISQSTLLSSFRSSKRRTSVVSENSASSKIPERPDQNCPLYHEFSLIEHIKQTEETLRLKAATAYKTYRDEQDSFYKEAITLLKEHGIGQGNSQNTLSDIVPSTKTLRNFLYYLCRRIRFERSEFTPIVLGLLDQHEPIDILEELMVLLPEQSHSEQLHSFFIILELIHWDDDLTLIQSSLFAQKLQSNAILNNMTFSGLSQIFSALIESKTRLQQSAFQAYSAYTDSFSNELSKKFPSADDILAKATHMVKKRKHNSEAVASYHILLHELQKISLTSWRNVRAKEFNVNSFSKEESRSELAPHISRNPIMSDGLCFYFAQKILDTKDNEQRADMICLLIRLAKDLFENTPNKQAYPGFGPDLNTTNLLVLTLNQAAITRLKETWSIVKKRDNYYEILEELNTIFSPQNNYDPIRQYQLHYKKALPMMSLALRDKTFINETKPNNALDDNLKQNKSLYNAYENHYNLLGLFHLYVRELRRQLLLYNNIPITDLPNVLERNAYIDKNALYLKSLKAQPKALTLNVEASGNDLINDLINHCMAGAKIDLCIEQQSSKCAPSKEKSNATQILQAITNWLKKMLADGAIERLQAVELIAQCAKNITIFSNTTVNVIAYVNQIESLALIHKKTRAVTQPVTTTPSNHSAQPANRSQSQVDCAPSLDLPIDNRHSRRQWVPPKLARPNTSTASKELLFTRDKQPQQCQRSQSQIPFTTYPAIELWQASSHNHHTQRMLLKHYRSSVMLGKNSFFSEEDPVQSLATSVSTHINTVTQSATQPLPHFNSMRPLPEPPTTTPHTSLHSSSTTKKPKAPPKSYPTLKFKRTM